MIPSLDSRVDLVKEQKQLFLKIFSKKDNTWKIIIYDQSNLNIITSLFKVKDFRQNNITLYFNIKDPRQQLHGVTAIYLIKPASENTEQIIKDFQKDLYSSVVVHFTSQPPAHLLSTFAKNLSKVKSSAISKVQKVQYSNIGFQCIDRQMCILPEITEVINLICILKNEPIFIYSDSERDWVENIKERLSNSVFGNKNLKGEQSSINILKQPKKYTKVLIFNRQMDYFPVVSHGITYASLMEDVWKFNKSGTQIVENKFQVDLNDEIWLQRKNMLISQMELDKECNKINVRLDNMDKKIEQYSQATERQKKIKAHLDYASAMIKQAKQRRLNEFHSVQEDLHIKKMFTGQSKRQFLQLLSSAPNPNDKTRLLLSYLTSVDNYDQNQVQELERAFPQIIKNAFYQQLKSKRSKTESQENATSKSIKKLAKGLWKNLVNQEKKYLLIKYLEKTKDLSEKTLSDLGLRMTALKEIPMNAQIQQSIVYCIGGVCFNQYANLSQFDPNTLYTGERLINYRQFI